MLVLNLLYSKPVAPARCTRPLLRCLRLLSLFSAQLSRLRCYQRGRCTTACARCAVSSRRMPGVLFSRAAARSAIARGFLRRAAASTLRDARPLLTCHRLAAWLGTLTLHTCHLDVLVPVTWRAGVVLTWVTRVAERFSLYAYRLRFCEGGSLDGTSFCFRLWLASGVWAAALLQTPGARRLLRSAGGANTRSRWADLSLPRLPCTRDKINTWRCRLASPSKLPAKRIASIRIMRPQRRVLSMTPQACWRQ